METQDFIKGILSRVSNSSNNTNVSYNPLRTDEVIGVFKSMPEINKSFVIFAEPIEKEYDYRQISTSVVTKVIRLDENEYIFHTLNSVYNLKIQ